MKRYMLIPVCVVLLTLLLSGDSVLAGPQGKLVYAVTVDVVRGSFQPLGPVCVQSNVYRQGEEVVWRVRVLDMTTGEDPGEAGRNLVAIQERGIKVTAFLESGLSFPMRYGQHPPRPRPGDAVAWFWTVSWRIPADHPTGSARWWVVVQDKAGAFVRFDPIGGGTNLAGSTIVVEKGQ